MRFSRIGGNDHDSCMHEVGSSSEPARLHVGASTIHSAVVASLGRTRHGPLSLPRTLGLALGSGAFSRVRDYDSYA